MSLNGPTPPTFAVQQVVGYLGYTGRAAYVVATAAHDPDILSTAGHDLLSVHARGDRIIHGYLIPAPYSAIV